MRKAFEDHWPGEQLVSIPDIMDWLDGSDWDADIEPELSSVLTELWQDAYQLGVQGAMKLTGYTGPANTQQEQNDLISSFAGDWVREIIDTLQSNQSWSLHYGDTFTADKAYAKRITETEVTRALNYGAYEIYRRNGDDLFDWEIGSSDPCEECIVNAADGPRHFGDPFPSGAAMPPQHVHCGCALIPHRER